MTASTSFVDAYAPHGPYVSPCSHASTSTHANVTGAVAPGPRRLRRTCMSEHTGELVSVKIIPNEKGSPAGKLADAEVIFEADAGPLSGLKLIGFSVWERRDGGRNVTFPARQYSVNGERRSYALLRASKDDRDAQAIRDRILDAYSRIEAAS